MLTDEILHSPHPNPDDMSIYCHRGWNPSLRMSISLKNRVLSQNNFMWKNWTGLMSSVSIFTNTHTLSSFFVSLIYSVFSYRDTGWNPLSLEQFSGLISATNKGWLYPASEFTSRVPSGRMKKLLWSSGCIVEVGAAIVSSVFDISPIPLKTRPVCVCILLPIFGKTSRDRYWLDLSFARSKIQTKMILVDENRCVTKAPLVGWQ